MSAQPIDLRRECHCERRPGIGPHWHSLLEGCPPGGPVDKEPEQPGDPVETDAEAAQSEIEELRRQLAVARTEHEAFGDREGALYVALRLTAGDDGWSAADVMTFADYLLAGREPTEPAEPAVCGHEIESLKVGKSGGKTLRCVLSPGHSTPTPHNDGKGTSWTRAAQTPRAASAESGS